MLEQDLCEVVVPLSPDCIMGVHTVSDWGPGPLPHCQTEACESTLQARLTGDAGQAPVRTPEFAL